MTLPSHDTGSEIFLTKDVGASFAQDTGRKLVVSDEFADIVPKSEMIVWLSSKSNQVFLSAGPRPNLDDSRRLTGRIIGVAVVIVGPQTKSLVDHLLPFLGSDAQASHFVLEAEDSTAALSFVATTAQRSCIAAEAEAAMLSAALASLRREHRKALQSVDRARRTLEAHGLTGMTNLSSLRPLESALISSHSGLSQVIPVFDNSVDQIKLFIQPSVVQQNGGIGVLCVELSYLSNDMETTLCELAIPGTYVDETLTIPVPILDTSYEIELRLFLKWNGQEDYAPKFALAPNPFDEYYAICVADRRHPGVLLAMEYGIGVYRPDQMTVPFLKSYIANPGWHVVPLDLNKCRPLLPHPDLYEYKLVSNRNNNRALLVHPADPGEETWVCIPQVIPLGIARVVSDISLSPQATEEVEFLMQVTSLNDLQTWTRPPENELLWKSLAPGDRSVCEAMLMRGQREMNSLLIATRMKAGSRSNGSAHALFERIRYKLAAH